MTRMRLTGKADIGVIYEAEQLRYAQQGLPPPVTRERAIEYLSRFPTVGYEIDGVAAGGAIFDGEELHLAVLPQFYGRWAWLLKPTLAWLFTMRDPVRIRIERSNARCLRFMDAGGWERIAEDDHLITYLVGSQSRHIFRRL